MATLGIITCEILELEFAHLLANDAEVAGVTVVDTGFSKGLSQAYELRKGAKPKTILKDMQPHTINDVELDTLLKWAAAEWKRRGK